MVKIRSHEGKWHIFRIALGRVPFLLTAYETVGDFALPDETCSWIAVSSLDLATAMSAIVVTVPNRRTA